MQLTMSEAPAAAVAGMKADAGFSDVISRLSATRQLEQVVIDTATDSGEYILTINGTNFEFNADTDATKAEIRDGLKAAIDAGSEPVSTESVSTDTLLVESTDHDTGFTFAKGGARAADMTLTTLVEQEQAIGFSKVVVEDERLTAGSSCRLPRLATDITGNKVLGVALLDSSIVTRASAPKGGYSAGESVPILKKGRVWMEVEDVSNVAKGGKVFVRHVATGTEELGAVRAADDGTDTDPIPNGAAAFTGKVSGSLAEVEWNLP